MQPVPAPTPTPPAPAAPSAPSLDIGGLASAIGQAFQTVLTSWAASLPQMALDSIKDGIDALWAGLWSSGANLLATPFALTVDFPPARILGRELTASVYAITVLAIVLLALRSMLRTMTGRGGALGDLVDGILIGGLLAGTATLIVGQAFMLAGLASDAIGHVNYTPAFDPQSALTIGPSIVLAIFTLVVMLVYGWKLMVRAAYRVVLLMFLAPFAPVAGILWAIPQTRWISVLYWVTLGGWLAGGFLAVAAISLGVQLVTVGNTNGVLSLIYGVALVQVAYDLMTLLPKGASGGMTVGSPFRIFESLAAGALGGAVGGAVAGGMAAASSGGSAGAAVVGALSAGDQPGYGY